MKIKIYINVPWRGSRKVLVAHNNIKNAETEINYIHFLRTSVRSLLYIIIYNIDY